MIRPLLLLVAIVAPLSLVAAEPSPLPPGAIARLGESKFRAPEGEFALSPDGKFIATVEGELIVRIRDVETWAERLELEAFVPPPDLPKRPESRVFSQAVRHLEFSQDGKQLAAAINTRAVGVIAIWDLATGKLVRNVVGRSSGFSTSFAFSANLAFSAWYGDARKPGDRTANYSLYVRENNSDALKTIPVGFFSVDDIAMSHDCKKIVAWSRTSRLPLEGNGPKNPPKKQTGPESKADQYGFKVWDISTGKELSAGRLQKPVKDVTWSPDGESLAVQWGMNIGEEAGIWDLKTGKFRSRFVCQRYPGPIFFLSNDVVGTVGLGGKLERRDAATGRLLDTLDGPAWEMAEPNALMVARADGSIRICGRIGMAFATWDFVPGNKKPTNVYGSFAGPCDSPASLAFTPDGKFLRSFDAHCNLHTWNVANRRIDRTQCIQGRYRLLPSKRTGYLTADARFAIVLGAKNRVWDCERDIETAEYPDTIPPSAVNFDGVLVPGVMDSIQKLQADLPNSRVPRNHFIVSPNALYAAALVNRPEGPLREIELRVFDITRMKAVGSTIVPREVPLFFAFSANGRLIVLLGWEKLTVWDWQSSRMICSVPSLPESVPGFSTDGRLMARNLGHRMSQDRGIEIRELASGTVRSIIPSHCIGAIAFSPDGKLLAASAPDATILLWDMTPPSGGAKWTPAEANSIWEGLANLDAKRGYEHMARLFAHPEAAIDLLRDRIKVSGSKLDISHLVRDLDANDLKAREAANRELTQLGEAAKLPLQKILEGNPSAEVRRRIEFLLDDLRTQLHRTAIRPIRVVEVLERIQSPAARELLEVFAKSPDETVLTREAKSALVRSWPAK